MKLALALLIASGLLFAAPAKKKVHKHPDLVVKGATAVVKGAYWGLRVIL